MQINGIKPHPELVKELSENRIPISSCRIFKRHAQVLAQREFESSVNLFQRRNLNGLGVDNLNSQIFSLITQIEQIERPHREVLCQLAVKTIQELLNIPEKILINPSLEQNIYLDTDQTLKKELTPAEQWEMESHIEKRILLNALCHGSSCHIWKTTHHIIRDEINRIDSRLMSLYDDYTSLISLQLWLTDPRQFINSIGSESQFVQGYNKVSPTNNGLSITCKAISFPVLLHEINKGAMEVLTMHGISPSLTRPQLEYLYSIADSYKHEFYHYILSPPIWTSLLDALNIDSRKLPSAIRNLSLLSTDELSFLIEQSIIDNLQAKNTIRQWKITE